MALQERPVGIDVGIRLRRPASVALFSLITLGFYSIVWYYKINRELRDFGACRGDTELGASRPWRSVIAITVGGLIFIPALVSYLRTVRRVQAVEQLTTGIRRPAAGLMLCVVTAVSLPLAGSLHRVGPVFSLAGLTALVTATYLIQSRLNAVWRATDSR